MSLNPLLSITLERTPTQVETNGKLVLAVLPIVPMTQTNVVEAYYIDDGSYRLLWSIPSEIDWYETRLALDKEYANILVWDRNVINPETIRLRLYTVGGVLVTTQEVTLTVDPVVATFSSNYVIVYNASSLHFYTVPTLSEFLTTDVQGPAHDITTFVVDCHEYTALLSSNSSSNVTAWIYSLPRIGKLGISLGAPKLLDSTSFPSNGNGDVSSWKNLVSLSTDQGKIGLLTLCDKEIKPLYLASVTGSLIDNVLLDSVLLTADTQYLYIFDVCDRKFLKLMETVPAVAPVAALGGQCDYVAVAFGPLVYLYRVCCR